MKGIGALLVILVHCSKPEIYAALFRPWFLMVFFFASGYVFRHHDGLYYLRLVKRTIIQLSVCEMIRMADYFRRTGSFIGWDNVIGAFMQSNFMHPKYSPIIWFVPCIVLSKVIFECAYSITGKHTWRFGLASLVLSVGGCILCINKIFLPWHLQTALLMQGILFMGFFMHKHQQEPGLNRNKAILFGVSTLVFVYTISRGSFSADLNLLNVSDWPRYLISGISGTLSLYLLCNKLKDSRILGFFGRNSLFFFAFQTYLITMYTNYMDKINVTQEPKGITCLIVVGLVTLTLSCFVVVRDKIYEGINRRYGKHLKALF